MPERAREAIAAWKRADAQAREAEARLKAAWDTYDAQHAEPPSAELMAEVSRLRSSANDKLTLAMRLTRRT